MLAIEALSRVDPSVAVLVDVHNTLVVSALTRWGSTDIQGRYLPRLAAGTVGAYALSEAGSGSDAFALAMRATDTADGFVLNGRKLWITNGAEAGRLHRLRDGESGCRLPRYHRVHRRA